MIHCAVSACLSICLRVYVLPFCSILFTLRGDSSLLSLSSPPLSLSLSLCIFAVVAVDLLSFPPPRSSSSSSSLSLFHFPNRFHEVPEKGEEERHNPHSSPPHTHTHLFRGGGGGGGLASSLILPHFHLTLLCLCACVCVCLLSPQLPFVFTELVITLTLPSLFPLSLVPFFSPPSPSVHTHTHSYRRVETTGRRTPTESLRE